MYGVDFPRPLNNSITSRFWESLSFWILCITFLVSAIILYFLRRPLDSQQESFLYCIFEILCIVIGNGNVRIRTGMEKLFFAAALVTAFLFVSIYLSNYSIHSLFDRHGKIDSFAALAKRDVPFYLYGPLEENIDYVSDMLRYFSL